MVLADVPMPQFPRYPDISMSTPMATDTYNGLG
jgi:hypothetical protein